jgi:predicted dehydrogenase
MPKTYRIAVIGCTKRGGYGHGIDYVWRKIPNAEIVAVADDDKVGLARASERLKVEKTFDDYRKMLDEVKPDVVSICPRWIDQHRDMVVAAAERGCHIYLEKPLCRTLAEADEMVAACDKTHVKLVIAHQTRYSPKVAVVKGLLAEGKIGKVLEYRGRGKEDANRGGGEDLWVLGTHAMDLIRALAGHPLWCFASVTQEGQPLKKAHVAEGNEGIGLLAGDSVRAMYGMPDGSTAYYATQRKAAGNPSRYAVQIYGSTGVLEVGFGHLPVVKYLDDPSWSPGRSGKAWQDVSSAGIGQPEPLKDGGLDAGNELAVADLLASIEQNREPLGNLREARGATEMIVACFESQRQGKPVALPLENRQNPLASLPA